MAQSPLSHSQIANIQSNTGDHEIKAVVITDDHRLPNPVIVEREREREGEREK
jgi:hypothetical protein